LDIEPKRGFDVGSGPGHKHKAKVDGGLEGVIVDARGRNPMYLPEDQNERVAKLMEWIEAMGTYPIDTLKAYQN